MGVLRIESLLLLLTAVCCAVVVVVAEVELSSGTRPLNFKDPVQYRDCGHLLTSGYNVSGVHVLYMNKTTPFLIHCDFVGDTAYNLIQRRQDGSVNFATTLQPYIAGFGNAQSDYWAGLNSINYLTSKQSNQVLTVMVQDWAGNIRYARYTRFTVLPNENFYQMSISGYSGSLPDDLSHNNGMTFHTYDQPDASNCAVNMRAGWWYKYCSLAMPNGRYYIGGPYNQTKGFYDGIYWQSWGGFGYSMKFVSMQLSSN